MLNEVVHSAEITLRLEGSFKFIRVLTLATQYDMTIEVVHCVAITLRLEGFFKYIRVLTLATPKEMC